jgi:hippurate hydrolase
MLDDGLCGVIPAPDVALAHHVLPFPAGQLGTRPGPVLSATDRMRITVHGAPALGGRASAAPPVTAPRRGARRDRAAGAEAGPS